MSQDQLVLFPDLGGQLGPLGSPRGRPIAPGFVHSCALLSGPRQQPACVSAVRAKLAASLILFFSPPTPGELEFQ